MDNGTSDRPSSLCSAHEQRIQRTEGALQDVSSQVAELMVATEYMKKEITDLRAQVKTDLEKISRDVNTKLDDVLVELRAQAKEQHERADKQDTKVRGLSEKVSHLEALADKRERRIRAFRKLIFTVMTAAAGAFGTWLINWITTHGK